jgi:beta-glucosidase
VEWDEQTTKGAGKKRAAKAAATTLDELTSAARSADVVIFVAAGMQSSEGRDLPDMELPGRQARAIAAVAAANPRTIVALAANGAVSLEGWADKSAAIIAMHYAGEATGQALADIITGAVNPSGKLTYTFARKLEDYPCHALGEWPAKLILPEDPMNPGMTPAQRKPTHAFTTEYNEGVFAGYRWLDEKKIEPAYAFGYGLSYTSFTLANARVTGSPRDGFKVTCDVKNSGEREGAEVVQVYVAPPENISQPRPPKELKGFARISLKPGETKAAEIDLRPAALASFHEKENHWITEPGDYQVLVGTSSRDIKEKLPLKVAETIEHEHY